MNSSNSADLRNVVHLAIPAFVLFCAMVNGLVAAVLYWKSKAKYGRYLQAQGVVSEIVKEKGSDGRDMIFPILNFRTPAGEYKVRNRYGRGSWKIQPGDVVPVIYDQSNPNEAEIENQIMQYALPLLFSMACVLGLICVPITYYTTR